MIAEGLETREQAGIVRRLKCRVAQRFYYSPPVAPGLVAGLLDAALPAVPVAAPALART